MRKITAKRICLLLLGVATIALGVAVSIKANLGTSPVSSLPYNLFLVSGLSVGTSSVVVHIFFIVLQLIILKKEFTIYNLLQLPLGIFFGTFIDLGGKLVANINCSNYLEQFGLCLIGVILVALGVTLEVEANMIMLAVEGFASAVSKKSGKKFGDIKTITDVALVASACIIGLVFLHQIAGVREGTVIAAVGVGQLSKVFRKLLFSKKK